MAERERGDVIRTPPDLKPVSANISSVDGISHFIIVLSNKSDNSEGGSYDKGYTCGPNSGTGTGRVQRSRLHLLHGVGPGAAFCGRGAAGPETVPSSNFCHSPPDCCCAAGSHGARDIHRLCDLETKEHQQKGKMNKVC